MKTIGLDDRQYSWVLKEKKQGKVSQHHKMAFSVLKKLFPFDNIYQEVTLPGSRTVGKDLIVDFFIPAQNLIVEVHGEQHYEKVGFFHKNQLEFLQGQARDNNKRVWCAKNDITLVELAYNEDENKWIKRLKKR